MSHAGDKSLDRSGLTVANGVVVMMGNVGALLPKLPPHWSPDLELYSREGGCDSSSSAVTGVGTAGEDQRLPNFVTEPGLSRPLWRFAHDS